MNRRYVCTWRINRRCNPERARWTANRWIHRLCLRRPAWVLAGGAVVHAGARGGRVRVSWQVREDAASAPDGRAVCVAEWPAPYALGFDAAAMRELRDEIARVPPPPRDVSPRELARRRAWWVRHRRRIGIAPGYLDRERRGEPW